jgi:hypothetical protein
MAPPVPRDFIDIRRTAARAQIDDLVGGLAIQPIVEAYSVAALRGQAGRGGSDTATGARDNDERRSGVHPGFI